ncbi:endochitinase [Galendromus occidentalis]|uniref:Endochitinase n=1 Tax=Galendromus occidentalis TaxID=34638 RepID=A0AAJ6VXG1_9ACAR|nr:endochitinase [Galendromus occidentalis]
MKTSLILSALLALVGSAVAAKPFLCYWEFWGVYRADPHKGTIDKIPVNLCTHVIYSFVGLDENSNTVKPLDSERMDSDLRALRALKQKNSALKVIAAIGGWGEGAAKYSRLVSNTASIDKFVASVKDFVKKYELDGFDLDWEFPGATDRGGSPSDKANLITLLKKLREALPGKLLTIAVAGPQYRIDGGYDVPNIAKTVDYINVMSYDLRGPWDQATGNHVGLYGNGISVSQVMQAWRKAGAPANKLIMGFAFYGKSFTLQNPSNNGIGAPASAGQAGEVSQEGGTLFYYEICERISKRGWKRVFDDATKGPYAFGENQWVGYEDVEGIKHKTDLINKEGFAGAMVWAIELDDQSGVCGGGKFPLANAVSKGLGGNSDDGKDEDDDEDEDVVTPSPKPDPTTACPQPKPTPNPNPGPTPDCSSGEEYIPHASQCSRYIRCVNGQPIEMPCPPGLIFDYNLKVCNWPDSVNPKLPAGCQDA